MENRTIYIVSALVLFTIALVTCTQMLTTTLKQIRFGQGTIYVKGCAEQEIQSDFVKWQGTINSSAPTLVSAYEKLERDLELIRKYMQDQGVEWDTIMFSPITIMTIYQHNEHGYVTNTVESYSLSQDFFMTSLDIPLVTKISQNITSLIKEGLSINSLLPQYFYLKIDELKITMLGEAAKDAKQRAEQLVSSNGSKVGQLRSAQQGVFQITSAYSSSVSDSGEYDTSSIMKRIKAVVTMEYAIEQ